MEHNTDKQKATACQKTPVENLNMKTDTQADALAGHRQGIATLQRKAAQSDKLAEALRLAMSQIETLAYRAFSDEVPQWLDKCDAMNCGKAALAAYESEVQR